MSNPRLHEIAKALGTTAKTLMAELSKEGFEYKTHMALVEDAAFVSLKKKYKDLEAKLESAKKEADEAPKVKKPKASSGKVVTQRTKAAKSKSGAADDSSDGDGKPIEFVQREEGQAGTVTMEQRVVKDGVLRRRRVEAAPTPASTSSDASVRAPSSEPSEKTAPATEAPAVSDAPRSGVIRRPVESGREAQNLSGKSVLRRVEMPPTPAAPVKAETQPTAPSIEAVQSEPAKPAPILRPAAQGRPQPTVAPSGRNLSAGSRLKIVDAPAIPPVKPSPLGSKPAPGSVDARSKTPEKPKKPGAMASAPLGDDTEEARALAAKKRGAAGARFEEPNRVTKKDLLGMMEEVEITRPVSRRPKKMVQRSNEKRATQITTPSAHKRVIRIDNEISVADLADRMGTKAADIIRKLISMGQMATIQHKLDLDTATLIASEYNYEVQNVAVTAESLIKEDAAVENSENMMHRPPIVTVMGHVDHGKTSLLDHIRKTRVVAGEAGGITQHIGAYQIEHHGKKISFIDTPGHAAFTAMRSRGAKLTDLVILVVAADEGVKPQTLEALAHAKAAKVPIIVAINKIDKPEAKPDVPMNELSGQGLVPEAWGGDTIYCKVSAHTGEGIPELLEMILLQAEVLDLKADPQRLAKGIVIESMLDKGKGPVARVIVQNGTLQTGQSLVCGTTFGKVRALLNDRGQQVKSAGPSTPVEVLGLNGVPEAGDTLNAVSEDAVARQASELQDLARKREESLKQSRMSLEDMFKKMQTGDNSELRMVLKGDVQGSLEAIADSLLKIKHDKVKVQILYKAVGAISESDVDLAAASGALVFGFNVRPTAQAKALAAKENVQIKTYDIIYELIDEVKLAMGGLLAPIIKENVLGQAEVREVFNISKVGPIAGCFVKSGKIVRNGFGRLLRDNVVVYTAKIQSLKRFKDDAKEVAEGYECGIRLENYLDLKPGDIIECFEQIQHQQAVG